MSTAPSPLLRRLEERAAELPALLTESRALVRSQLMELPEKEHAETQHAEDRPQVWDVVGVGASSLPAELLVHVLASRGVGARHLPLSAFVGEASEPMSAAAAERGLVVFSQGLSPNARLALPSARLRKKAFLVTAIQASGSGEASRLLTSLPPSITVVRHLPESEDGALLRVQGPLCAADAALQLAEVLLAHAGARETKATTSLGDSEPFAPFLRSDAAPQPLEASVLTWLALDVPVLTARAAAWFWQEGLHEPAAPALDLLAFAHGAFQATWARPGVHVLLARHVSAHTDLIVRLRAMLPPHQRLVALETAAPPELAPVVLAAQVTRLALAEMHARGLDPSSWPGQGKDEPLYRLGE